MGHGLPAVPQVALLHILYLEQDALHVWPTVVGMETKFSAHLQHDRVFAGDLHRGAADAFL